MASNMIDEKFNCEKKEFFGRMVSSFLFIPAVALLFLAPYRMFPVICWGSYAIMIYEIFFAKTTGKILLRILAAFVCCLGVISFVYCRDIAGPLGCMFLICISSFADIGAYSFGKIFKGPKLCPKISPNKTWSGVCGGILFANVAFFCFRISLFQIQPEYPFWHTINFTVVQTIIMASIIGDLLESLFKRKIGVKDMGDLFPGHGGVLDRLDSLILASIAFSVIDFCVRL